MMKKAIILSVVAQTVIYVGCAAGRDMVIKEQGMHGNPVAVGENPTADLDNCNKEENECLE